MGVDPSRFDTDDPDGEEQRPTTGHDLRFYVRFSRVGETVSGEDLLRVFWKATGHVRVF